MQYQFLKALHFITGVSASGQPWFRCPVAGFLETRVMVADFKQGGIAALLVETFTGYSIWSSSFSQTH